MRPLPQTLHPRQQPPALLCRLQITGPSEGPVAESVFIAGMFVKYGRAWTAICRRLGLEQEADAGDEAIAAVEKAVLDAGWDGAWFRRAFDAFGHVVGGRECEEGQIFIEPQGMCVMAGIGKETGEAARALESKKAKETIANLQGEVACLKQKLESQQQELDDLKVSVENDYVPVAIIEEGIRDYAEETDAEQGHNIFIILNLLLAGNIPWAKCTRRLKAFFKKAMKEFNEMKRMQNITNQFGNGSSANVFNDKVEGKFDNGRTEE